MPRDLSHPITGNRTSVPPAVAWGPFHWSVEAIRYTPFVLFILGIGFHVRGVHAQEPTQRLAVHGVSFDGNRYLDDYRLRISIATSQSGWWARGPLRFLHFGEDRYFNEIEFRRDVLRILLLYRASGFFETSVDTIVGRSSNSVNVRFVINEGEPVRVTGVTVHGIEDIIPSATLVPGLPLKIGQPFDRSLFLFSADSIRLALRNRGYPYAQVFRNFDEQRRARVATVEYEVDAGPRMRIDSVEVIGERRVDERVIRRVIPVRPGDLYSDQRLAEGQRDLYRLGLFDYVDVSLRDTLPRPSDSTAVIRAQVSEGPLNRVRAGVGAGTFDCIRTLTSWTVGDFLGDGRTLDVATRISKIGAQAGTPFCVQDSPERDKLNFSVSAGIRFPYVLSRRTSASVSVVGERRSEFNAFVRKSVGLTGSITRQTRADVPITLSLSVSTGQTLTDPGKLCTLLNVCLEEDYGQLQQTRLQSTFGVSVVRDRSNSVLDPTRGTRTALELRAATVGNPSVQFIRGVADFSSYHPIGERSVFSWRIRLGATFTAHFDRVPIEERFYSGGANSVRGFGQNELGKIVYVTNDVGVVFDQWDVNSPFDPLNVGPQQFEFDASPVGGQQTIVTNAELRFPLPIFQGRLDGSIFVDAGQVFTPIPVQFESEHTVSDLGDLRITPGAGIRVRTPLGPLRLDVAYNSYGPRTAPLYLEQLGRLRIYPFPFQPQSMSHIRVNFSVGQAF
jgi:outer membrane protein insertion porin family